MLSSNFQPPSSGTVWIPLPAPWYLFKGMGGTSPGDSFCAAGSGCEQDKEGLAENCPSLSCSQLSAS